MRNHNAARLTTAVLKLTRVGFSSRKVAKKLGIPLETVERIKLANGWRARR